jgi:hypothetical protein
MTDNVNHPKHYTSHPSGIECIEITEHLNFCAGSAFKYIWRAELKEKTLEDLQKALFYVDREIKNKWFLPEFFRKLACCYNPFFPKEKLKMILKHETFEQKKLIFESLCGLNPLSYAKLSIEVLIDEHLS